VLTNISRVRVRALPSEIPHEIAVDLSGLVDLDAAIHVRDLIVADGVQLLADGDEMVAKVLPPRVEEEPVVAAEGELAAEAAAGEAPAGEAGAAGEPGAQPAEPGAQSAE
jgi:large subunit ribosomal protein L25